MKFKPGVSGNPRGGALHRPYRDALRRAIARAERGNKPHTLDRIADRHLQDAANGDLAAIRELADRIDGKVPQATGQDAELGPQRLVISWRSDPEPEVIEHVQAITLPTPEKDEG